MRTRRRAALRRPRRACRGPRRDPFADLKELAQLHAVGRADRRRVRNREGEDPRRRRTTSTVTANAARPRSSPGRSHAASSGDRRRARRCCTPTTCRRGRRRCPRARADELIAELDRRDDAFSDIELEVAPLDVGGDYACVEWSVTMTHTGPLAVADGASIEPTGVRDRVARRHGRRVPRRPDLRAASVLGRARGLRPARFVGHRQQLSRSSVR